MKFLNYLRPMIIWSVALYLCITIVSAGELVLVTGDVLNVRHEPDGNRIGRVYWGQQFELLQRQDSWGMIQFERDHMGWVHLDYVQTVKSPEGRHTVEQYCQDLNQEFKKLRWQDIDCKPEEWQNNFFSVQGRPLIYTVIGEKAPTSLLICSVHSDENTSYQCFRLVQWLKENPSTLKTKLVIVPLINPDGFFGQYKTRTNANRIDLNRNLPTSDWYQMAQKAWGRHYQRDKRLYPGELANSEPENQFLISLMSTYSPDKLFSIHSPLNFLDLDYMDESIDDKAVQEVNEKANALAVQFTEESQFVYKDYRTFPGSLGRYGDEWKIPVYTLEMPSSDPFQAHKYFERFRSSFVKTFNAILGTQRTALKEQSTPPLM
ncbi:MAG: succinylglutamate desuccinylase/aspartoacylase family protein [SAR324 cluster bacterium]|nr:succinylglutamate desuccinylase/aspartoacylase family protein [SAR324 cluster bacterium]